MNSNELRTAKLSAASGLIGMLIGSLVTFSGTVIQSWTQTKIEVAKVRAEAAIQTHKDFLLKSEKLFGALSELLSFFDANHSYERKQAKAVIAQARKAAWELAVFTSPELALKAITAVEALNQGADANDMEQLNSALADIFAINQELVASFYKERSMLDQKMDKALE